MKRRLKGISLLFACLCLPALAPAQEVAAPVVVPELPGAVASALDCNLVEGESADVMTTATILLTRGIDCVDSFNRAKEVVRDAARDMLESPETQSRVLNAMLNGDHGWQFLKDVNFKVKTFESENTGESALGFSYEYSKSLQSHDLPCSRSACTRGLDLQLFANGNVAANSDRNPNNLLDTQLSFAFFQSIGGVSKPTAPQQQQINRLRQQFIAAEDDDEEERAVQDIVLLVRPLLSDQFYWEVAGDAALESDQQFERKQYTFGVHAVFELKAWNDASALAKFNLIDYPFAAIRSLTGYEECAGGGSGCFKPRGTAWPSILVGVDRVKADDDAPRSLVGETSDYDRLRLEASFRTPVARYGDDRLFISVNYRYYEEMDAPLSVRAADLNSFSLFTVALGGEDGIYVSYTDGRLPFDLLDDRVFELGFQFHR